jgi:hypothetical protein
MDRRFLTLIAGAALLAAVPPGLASLLGFV